MVVDPLPLGGRRVSLDNSSSRDGVFAGQSLGGDLIVLVPLLHLCLWGLHDGYGFSFKLQDGRYRPAT